MPTKYTKAQLKKVPDFPEKPERIMGKGMMTSVDEYVVNGPLAKFEEKIIEYVMRHITEMQYPLTQMTEFRIKTENIPNKSSHLVVELVEGSISLDVSSEYVDISLKYDVNETEAHFAIRMAEYEKELRSFEDWKAQNPELYAAYVKSMKAEGDIAKQQRLNKIEADRRRLKRIADELRKELNK